MKSRYFRSGRNTRKNTNDCYNPDEEYEVFNIEHVLNNKKLKKAKINSKILDCDFNPYDQGRVKIEKKKLKEDLNMKRDNIDAVSSSEDEAAVTRENYNKENNDYESRKRFYERMLIEGNKTDNFESKNNVKGPESSENFEVDAEKKLEKEEDHKGTESSTNNIEKGDNCLICGNELKDDINNHSKIKLKKNENPCLLAPGDIK